MMWRDRLSYGGAWMTAIEVMAWWKERGYEVSAWVEKVPLRTNMVDRPIYMVRSDIGQRMTLDTTAAPS